MTTPVEGIHALADGLEKAVVAMTALNSMIETLKARVDDMLNRIGTLEQRIEVLELRERERTPEPPAITHGKWDNCDGIEYRWSEEDFRGKA